MGTITPLAAGPLSACEQAVLDAIPATRGTHARIADAAGVTQRDVEEALAQLTRRGLITRPAATRARPRNVRALPAAQPKPDTRPPAA